MSSAAAARGEEPERESEHAYGDAGVGEKLLAVHVPEGNGPHRTASLP